MHVLVTGAGGYIGAVLTAKLLEMGHSVSAVDRFFFGEEKISNAVAPERLKIVRADIRDLTPAHFEGVDAVCDLAALSNDPAGDLDPSLTDAVNHHGRLHVAKSAQAAGVRRYVLSSSCSVYGHGGQLALDETSEPKPITTYAKANLRAEESTLTLSRGDFVCAAIRNATVFGLSPRMRFDLVVNLMTLNAVQKGKIFVLGGGRQWRPLVHVTDVANAFVTLLQAEPGRISGEVFNIGLENYQVLSVAYIVRETVPFRIEVEVAPDDADKRDYHVSFAKAERVLGFRAETPVAKGVSEIYEALKMGRVSASADTVTVAWYRSIIEAEKLINRVRLNGRLL